MYSLPEIVARNRAAVELGVVKAGTAVGTEQSTDLPTYPFSVAGGVDENGATVWTVVNYATGESFTSYPSCDDAHDEAARLKAAA